MKTYDEALNEAAEKETYSKICFNGLEYAFGLKTHENCIEAFKLGAAFGLAWQKQREAELIARLKELGQAMPPNSISMHINRALKSHEENGD